MIGKNTNFVVTFDVIKQKYNVFYKEKFLISEYRFDNVKSYLD